jgi:hypothetical protein
MTAPAGVVMLPPFVWLHFVLLVSASINGDSPVVLGPSLGRAVSMASAHDGKIRYARTMASRVCVARRFIAKILL